MHTPELYRVLPWVRGARTGEPGHPLFTGLVQGAGRIDNPERYRALYASDSPAGAIAEAVGNHGIWTSELLLGRPDLPGSVRVLAVLDAGKLDVLDLDDARALIRLRLRPSSVVTRDRRVTQRWALSAFEEKRWAGLRWWSYHDPRWGAFGLWSLGSIRVIDVRPLTSEDPALLEAGAILARPWR